MLYTLHGYILRELGKVFGIAAVSLTLILSLGGLLKPLRDQGVEAAQVFQLLTYIFPVMLTFSLPVAALLAATLVYGRLSADNELIACRASGISMWSLVLPGIGLGMLVLLSNLLLGNWFIPHCARRAADVVRREIQDIAFNKLHNDGELTYERWVVQAERVERTGDNPPRIRLIAPSMVLRGRLGLPEQVVMCQSATLEFDPAADSVTIYPVRGVMMDWQNPTEPATVRSQPMRLSVRPIIRDKASFKTYGELLELRQDPSLYYRVKNVLDRCRRLTERKLLYDEIERALSPRGDAAALPSYAMQWEDFRQNPSVLREVVIQANDVQRLDDGLILGRTDQPGIGVTVTLLGGPGDDGGPAKPEAVYTSQYARLAAVTRDDSGGPLVDVLFPGQFWRAVPGSQAPPAVKPSGALGERLVAPERLTRKVAAMSIDELEATPLIGEALDSQIERLNREIVAELHSRAAFAVAGLVLVVLGAALGVIFRSGHALVAFGVAAVPAMFAITMVIMGNQVANNTRSSVQELGVPMTWSGNVLILGLVVWTYAKILKH